MKNPTSLVVSIFALLSFSSFASASDTINITVNGALKAASCDVKINGGSADAAVHLDTVYVSTLNRDGVAGAKSFTLELSNCDPTLTTYPYFQNTQNSVNPQGRLMNTSTVAPATNVDLELLNASNSPVNLSALENLQNAGAPVIPVGGDASFKYTIQYRATGAVTAGSVSSSLTYVIKYL